MSDLALPKMETRNITFDPVPHTYTDEFKQPYISVTTLIHTVEPEYDSEFWAMYRAVDQMPDYRPYPFPESREIELRYNGKRQKYSIEFLYTGLIPTYKTPDEIRAEWQAVTDESCDWGTNKHEYLEDCVNRFAKTNQIKFHDITKNSATQGFAFKVMNIQELEASPLKLTYPAIYTQIEKMIKSGWVAYAEKRVYSAYHKVAGTIDLLFVRGRDIAILDWKTNKEVLQFTPGYFKKEWNADRTVKQKTNNWVPKNDRLLHPLTNVPHCNGMIYTLQLSLYAFICEMWGYNPTHIILCHIRPKLDKHREPIKREIDGVMQRVEEAPVFYKIDYLRNEVHTLLEYHRNR